VLGDLLSFDGNLIDREVILTWQRGDFLPHPTAGSNKQWQNEISWG
jgi:hypothetical protein